MYSCWFSPRTRKTKTELTLSAQRNRDSPQEKIQIILATTHFRRAAPRHKRKRCEILLHFLSSSGETPDGRWISPLRVISWQGPSCLYRAYLSRKESRNELENIHFLVFLPLDRRKHRRRFGDDLDGRTHTREHINISSLSISVNMIECLTIPMDCVANQPVQQDEMAASGPRMEEKCARPELVAFPTILDIFQPVARTQTHISQVHL